MPVRPGPGFGGKVFDQGVDENANLGREAAAARVGDEMLDDIMLHWLGNAGASSARLYREGRSSMSGPPATMRTPTAISMFPKVIARISRRWAERRFATLVHFNELPAGGHFAALEQPALLIEEIRAGFRGLRT